MDICDYVNHFKVFFLLIKTGSDVLVQVLKTLYNGPKPIEHHLLELTDKKSTGLNKDQRKTLENIKLNDMKLEHMDITLTYKLIQLTCNLEPREDSVGNLCVWSERCRKEKQNCLEHLLFKYKSKRNHYVHHFATIGKISDEVFEELKKENIDCLMAIMDKVKEKADLEESVIKAWKKQISEETEMICQLSFTGPILSPLFLSMNVIASSERPLGFIFNSLNDTVYNIFKGEAGAGFGQNTRPLEKSDRMYWVNKLMSFHTLADEQKLKLFWEEYQNAVQSEQ